MYISTPQAFLSQEGLWLLLLVHIIDITVTDINLQTKIELNSKNEEVIKEHLV